ncbi:MAG: TIGR00730 family Rossman fold protein [Candidatus Melainabacteria bacterium]|nr:TIGR00730 family Rossman fold protein [Candidatus Melainabacteria bacterium]
MFKAKQLVGIRGSERQAAIVQLFSQEMHRGLTALESMRGRDMVTIFGTARRQKGHADYDQAYRLGYKVAKSGLLVMQGGGPGAMEGSAEGAVAAGGQAVSVCLKLPHEEKPNPFGAVNLEHQFFPTRKAIFLEYSVGFIVVKGGFGTLDELFEVLCSIQCGMTTKVPVYLIGTKFWNPLDVFIRESLLSEGMIGANDVNLYTVTDDEDEAVDGIVSHWKGRAAA